MGPLWAGTLNGWRETLQNGLPSVAVLVEVYVNRKLHRLRSWSEEEAASVPTATGTQKEREPTLCQREPSRLRVPATASLPIPP